MSKVNYLGYNVAVSNRNVFETNNSCIGFVYKLDLIDCIYNNYNSVELQSLTRIIKKVNMYCTIHILPEEFDKEKYKILFMNNYQNSESEFEKQFLEELYDQVDDIVSYDYQVYLVFVATKKESLASQGIRLFEKEVVEGSSKNTKLISDEILRQAKKITSKISKTSYEETINLINYLNIPVTENVLDFDVVPGVECLEYAYRIEEEYKKIYSKTLIVSKLPSEFNDNFTIFTMLKQFPEPIEVSLKLSPIVESKDYGETIKKSKEKILKAQESEKLNKGFVSQELIEKEALAEIAEVNLDTGKSAVFKLQIMIRLKSESRDELKEIENEIIKRFGFENIILKTNVGQDHTYITNFLPYKLSLKKYIHEISEEFFTKFNLLGGSSIGVDTADSTIIAYEKPSKRPVPHSFLATNKGETNATEPNIIVTASTGGGKSQLVNLFAFMGIVIDKLNFLLIDFKGDRVNFLNDIPNAKEIVNLIVIGEGDEYKGCLDPFLFSEGINNQSLKLKVMDLVITLLRITNKGFVVKNSEISNAYEKYINSNVSRRTFTEFVDVYLREENSYYADEVLYLKNVNFGLLYFGDDDTKELALNNRFNIVTVKNVRTASDLMSKNRELSLEQELSLVVLSNIEQIVQQYTSKKLSDDQIKCVIFEELKVYFSYCGSGGVENSARMVRSTGGFNILISQEFTDMPESIINQCGTFFIGGSKSKESFEAVTDYFELDKDQFSFIRKNVTEEIPEEEKYKFLYVDPNGKRGIIRTEFLPMFKKAFDTHVGGSVKNE